MNREAGINLLIQKMAQLMKIAAAPKVVVRDENGRAIGARVVLDKGTE